jgi:GTP-binding protein
MFMPESNFVDYIKIFCRSGKGGAGSAHLRREKFIPKGGPDGGDGGRGGNIILKGNHNLWTLLHLRYMKHIYAGNGESGASATKTGADGKDIVVEVPLGTIVRDEETGKQLLEITENEETKTLLKGGRGGQGNVHFKSATNQTPRYAQPGEEGIEKWLIFELKVLADVGLVGFPNAGKSTLLSTISEARPKIADYAFTTLEPSIGIVPHRQNHSFVVADIPGIIEGASEGKGLGLRFLRHIERNSILLFMVPADSKDIHQEYRVLLEELGKFNAELLDKRRILAITKSDLLDEELMKEITADLPVIPYIFISSVTQYNIVRLKDMLWEQLNT